MLADLGLTSVRILTDHPRRMPALAGFGIEITGCISLGDVAGAAVQRRI